jgi:hypothetical protein
MRKTLLNGLRLALSAAVVSMTLGGPALANDTPAPDMAAAAEIETAKPTRAPHKVANKFHARLGGENAEVARVEMIEDTASGPSRPRFKSGNRYHGAD